MVRMSGELTVAVAQPVTTTGDVEANAARHAEAVVAAGARLVIFPELSLTGYDLEAGPVDPEDSRLGALMVACARTGTLALAGAPVEGADRPFIAVLAIGSAGDDQRARPRVVYRKRHLGPAEQLRFAPGDAPTTIEIDGWRVGLGICKDTGTPEHVQAMADLDLDLYAAGLVHRASERTETERRAQVIAAATGAPVALASFAGPTGSGYDATAAHSGIWSAAGARLADAGDRPGAIATHTLTRPQP
jgi:predicted amidohydrolase